MVVLMLAFGSGVAVLSHLLGRRRRELPAHAVRVLRVLFWVGAPASGVVASVTDFNPRLAVGLIAAWAVLLASLGLVLLATRGQPGGRRAETVLAVCWPNAAWLGFPAVVLVFGWDALPLAVAFSQLCSGPFTQVVVPGTAAALMHQDGRLRARIWAFARNPYAPCVGAGYLAGAVGLAPPGAVVTAGRTVLLWISVPAFAAVGAALAGQRLRPNAVTLRLAGARLAIASLPLLALRQVLPIPAPFVLQAGMAVGMSSFQVAAAYRVPTGRLAPALALTTVVVGVAVAAVPALR
jgi:predicted permease